MADSAVDSVVAVPEECPEECHKDRKCRRPSSWEAMEPCSSSYALTLSILTISFTVDTDGSIIYPLVSNHAVVNDVEIFIMDQEALRTIMIMPDWIPAEQDGKPVQAQHQATVSFGSGGGRGGFGF